MAQNKRGRHSFILPEPAVITAWASVAGKKESEGPLSHTFDKTSQDTYFGQSSWELAEKAMQETALRLLLEKGQLERSELDLVLSGDLLNQCIGSAFTMRNTGTAHLGLYGACSTMAESLLLGSLLVCSGTFDRVAAMTSSHFASSERQYRFPLGYGGQRAPHNPMDRHRSRGGSALRPGEGTENHRLHRRHRHRPGHPGCQQYGRRHGPGGFCHHPAAYGGPGQAAGGL